MEGAIEGLATSPAVGTSGAGRSVKGHVSSQKRRVLLPDPVDLLSFSEPDLVELVSKEVQETSRLSK